MEPQLRSVPIDLGDGVVVRVQATALDESSTELALGEEVESDVSVRRRMKEVSDSVVGIARTIKGALDEVKPTKVSIEFGLEFGFEAGQLTALIIQGSEKANLKIAIEWEADKP